MTTHNLDIDELSQRAPLAMLFHENSKITRASRDWLTESLDEFAANDAELRKSLTAAKTYPGADRIPLPDRAELPPPSTPLSEVLARRRSVREYADRPIPLRLLGSLLEHAYGVTARVPLEFEGGVMTQSLRAAPSGGGLYPIELYVVAFPQTPTGDADLRSGAYHYHPLDRCLELVRSDCPRSAIEPLVFTPDNRLAAPVLIVLTGRWQHALAKYGERGYRVMLLDAGHVAQNLMLAATSLGLASCPLAGFLDDPLASELRLDSNAEPVLCLLSLGFPLVGQPFQG